MATLSIATTAAADTRINKAFGTYLNLGRNATGPEVKAAITQFMRGVVTAHETHEAAQTAAGNAPIDVT